MNLRLPLVNPHCHFFFIWFTRLLAYAGARKSPPFMSLVRAMLGKEPKSLSTYMTIRQRIDLFVVWVEFGCLAGLWADSLFLVVESWLIFHLHRINAFSILTNEITVCIQSALRAHSSCHSKLNNLVESCWLRRYWIRPFRRCTYPLWHRCSWDHSSALRPRYDTPPCHLY